MNICINGNFVSVDFATASRQDIADFCIYDITEIINMIDIDGYKVKADIYVDLYNYGGQCSWEYDVEDTEVCYAIGNGVTQVLDFIGSAYDEIQDMIKAIKPENYMVGELDGVPSTSSLEKVGEILDKLYIEIEDELYKFIKSDWYEGRGL